MPCFSHFYAHNQFVLYELTVTLVGGRPMYTAILSADPRLGASSRRADVAVAELQALVLRLQPAARQHVA